MAKDVDHPFFRPLWRRVGIVVFTAGWSAIEWAHGESTWGMITAGLAAYAAYAFLLRYRDPTPEEPK